MDFLYGEAFTEGSPEAYERLILDVLIGDPPLFPRNAEVEDSWRVIDPLEEFWAEHTKPDQYAPGGGGPARPTRCWPRDGRAWRRLWRSITMTIDLTDTTTGAIGHALTEARAGSAAMPSAWCSPSSS